MTEDLYEYPADYVGRKTYVSVRGHSRSIPKYKTYVGHDRRNYLTPEFGGNWDALPNGSTFVMPDKAAYLSPLDFKVVDGRSAHRDHMTRHGVIEAGDVSHGHMTTMDRAPMQRAGYDIQRAIQELSSR